MSGFARSKIDSPLLVGVDEDHVELWRPVVDQLHGSATKKHIGDTRYIGLYFEVVF